MKFNVIGGPLVAALAITVLVSCQFHGDGSDEVGGWELRVPEFNTAPWVYLDPFTEMTTGDFNGDSLTDIAFTYFANDWVGVVLNLGGGDFSAPSYFYTGPGPQQIEPADFNQDGNLDLVTLNTYKFPDGFSVLLGAGDGTFGAAIGKSLGDSFKVVKEPIIGLFTSDVYPDLALIFGNSVYLFPGNGDGSFQDAVITDPPSVFSSFEATAGLFDSDSLQDLVVQSGGLTGDVLLSNGDGTFSAQSISYGFNPHIIAAGDFNHAGGMDLIVAESGFAQVMLGNGDGTFGVASGFSVAGFGWLDVMDADGDGNQDVVGMHYSNYTVTLLPGMGDGTFGPGRVFLAGVVDDAKEAGVANLNGDSIPDLIVPQSTIQSAALLYGNGDGSFQAPEGSPMQLRHHVHAMADFNGDGILDFISGQGGNPPQGVSVGLGNGDGSFQPYIYTYTLASGTGPTAVGDLDNDGFADTVLLNGYLGYTDVFKGNGDGTFTSVPPNVVLNFPPGGLHRFADLDRDGNLDLITGTFSDGLYNLGVFLGNGDCTFQKPRLYWATNDGDNVVVGDVNGDGIPDVVTAGRTPFLSVFLGKGDGTLGQQRSYFISPTYAFGSAIGDLNHDGINDISVGANQEGVVAILYGRKNNMPREPVFLPVGEWVAGTAIVDMNRDGYNDLLVMHGVLLTVFFGTPDGELVPALDTIMLSTLTEKIQVVEDINNDGLPDLLHYSSIDGMVFSVLQQ